MKIDTAARHQGWARRIVQFILEQHGITSAGAISRHVGTSQTLCRDAFCELTGESIEDFCRRIRLERAAENLSGGDNPIWDVAMEAGYATQSGFDRAFQSHFGCTPTCFREVNPGGVAFPTYAQSQGFEPGRQHIEVGVYTRVRPDHDLHL